MTGAERMAAFGYKTAWYAVRDRTRDDVLAALGLLGRTSTTDWSSGIGMSYNPDTPSIAVTPPIAGRGGPWVLVTSRNLMDENPHVARMSGQLGGAEVQYFVSDRTTETHGWARADSGALRRLFVFSGESGGILAQHGPREPVDLPADHRQIDESDVMTLAGHRSIDPQTLPSLPYAGDLVLAR